MHEYTIINHPKPRIIFYLAVISIFLSHWSSNVFQPWLQEHLHVNLLTTFTISGFTIYAILYMLFNYVLWKIPFLEKVLHVPNLNGEWECIGLSDNIALNKKFSWEGTVVIKQSWDKILISLRTKTSTSQSLSVAGGIKYLSGLGYQLSYHYANNPNASSEADLKKHEGYCILTFVENGKTAEGCYFNNIKDRQSYGEMKLKRRIG